MRLRIVSLACLLALAQDASAADPKARKKLDDNYIPFTGEEFVKRVFLSDKSIVELFLQAGFAVDTSDGQGYTALRRAADQSDGKLLPLLLAAGANPNLADNNGTTALCIAAGHGATQNLQALLRAKADPHVGCGFDKNTPLHSAVRQGDLAGVQALLAAGVEIDARNRTGETPLYQAASWGESLPILQALLAAGADLKAKDHGGDTPLHGANNHRSVPFVQALLAAGADVDARNGRGETALFEAARNDHAELVTTLLNAGADPTLAANTAVTPLAIAKQVGSMRAMALLKDAGSLQPGPEDEAPRGARRRAMHRSIAIALLTVGLCGWTAQAEFPRERAAKLMKKLATDKKPDVRAEAAKALGDMGAWDAVPALAAALKDPFPQVRAGAAYALVELKEHAKGAVPALKEALGDRDRLVVYNVVVALHNMEAATPAELAPALGGLVDESDKEDLESLVRMLVNLGFEDPTARKTILATLEQGRREVRLQILQELWHQETMEQSGAWKAEVVSHLVPLVTGDRDPKIRRQAIVLLWRTHASSGPAGEALVKALDDPDPEVARQAAGTINGLEHSPLPATALAHLTRKLKSADPLQRAAAAHALSGFIGWREKFTPLLTAALLNDKEPDVRLAVVAALGELDDDAAIPGLLKALKNDADPRVKAAVCTIWSKSMVKLRLARTNNLEAALAALEAARGDANPRVKAAAEAALAELHK